jgi:hypothetical protein
MIHSVKQGSNNNAEATSRDYLYVVAAQLLLSKHQAA